MAKSYSGKFPLSGEYDCVSIDIGIKNFAIRREIWGETVIPKLFQKINFGANYLIELNRYLNWILHSHLCKANVIVIERQLHQNLNNKTVFDVVLNFLLSRLDILKPNVFICDISAKCKSKCFGVTGLKSYKLKKWSVQKAIEILTEREDTWSLEWLLYHKEDTKADDLADTILQIEALMALKRL